MTRDIHLTLYDYKFDSKRLRKSRFLEIHNKLGSKTYIDTLDALMSYWEDGVK